MQLRLSAADIRPASRQLGRNAASDLLRRLRRGRCGRELGIDDAWLDVEQQSQRTHCLRGLLLQLRNTRPGIGKSRLLGRQIQTVGNASPDTKGSELGEI